MTALAETTVLVDAAQVHAEGVLAGLKTAASLIARTPGVTVPLSLRRALHEWTCNAIHYEWRAQQDRPVTYERDAQVRALISHVLTASGLTVTSDDQA